MNLTRKCLDCEKHALPERSRCQKHLNKEAKYARQHREKSLLENKCCGCGKSTLTGGARCIECADMVAKRTSQRKERLKSGGLCIRCGKIASKKTLCELCSIKGSRIFKRLSDKDKARVLKDFEEGAFCRVCGAVVDYRVAYRICIHHNHETGRYLFLSCSGCNTVLGMAGDDPNKLIQIGEKVKSLLKGISR